MQDFVIKKSYIYIYSRTHGLSKAHQTVKGRPAGREFGTFKVGNSKGVVLDCEAGNVDFVRHDVPSDVACTIPDVEGGTTISEGTAGLRTEEFVVALYKRNFLVSRNAWKRNKNVRSRHRLLMCSSQIQPRSRLNQSPSR